MMHVLKNPILVRLPRPWVFVTALLAAVLGGPFAELAGRWHWNPFWGYLAAAVAAIVLADLAERLANLLLRLLRK
jgi:hypothetical protein